MRFVFAFVTASLATARLLSAASVTIVNHADTPVYATAIPRNVHFHATGSAVLAKQVAQSIQTALCKEQQP